MGLECYDTVSAAEEGRQMKLPDPGSGGETGEFITFFGSDSGIYKNTMAEFAKKNKLRGRDLTDAEREEQDIECLARMTKTWKLTENGKAIPFSHEEARRVYTKYPSVKRRATVFIFTESNFFGTASGS